jgi:hypothetical protein
MSIVKNGWVEYKLEGTIDILLFNFYLACGGKVEMEHLKALYYNRNDITFTNLKALESLEVLFSTTDVKSEVKLAKNSDFKNKCVVDFSKHVTDMMIETVAIERATKNITLNDNPNLKEEMKIYDKLVDCEKKNNLFTVSKLLWNEQVPYWRKESQINMYNTRDNAVRVWAYLKGWASICRLTSGNTLLFI